MITAHNAWRRLRFWVLVQILFHRIDRGVRHHPLLAKLGVEFAPGGSRQYIRAVRGLRALWVARRGTIPPSSLQDELLEVPRDELGFHVFEFEDRFLLMAGPLRQIAVDRVVAEIVKRMFLLFSAAHPPITTSVIGEQLAVLHAGGRNQLVIGHPRALAKLVPLGFKPLAIDLKDAELNPVMPDDLVFVVSPSAYRFVIWGRPWSRFYLDEDGRYAHLQMRWGFGGVVHHPDHLGRVGTEAWDPRPATA